MTNIIQCGICGRHYNFHTHYCGDQSMCFGCKVAAKKAVEQPDTEEQKRRRQQHFGEL